MNRFSRSGSIAYRVRNGVAIGFFLGPGVRNICLGTIGAARVHAAAVIIKFVPQLGDDVVRNHVCRACILCIKTLAAAGAEPALLVVAIFFTRVGAFRMVLCGKKIIDGRKAESKSPSSTFMKANCL